MCAMPYTMNHILKFSVNICVNDRILNVNGSNLKINGNRSIVDWKRSNTANITVVTADTNTNILVDSVQPCHR